ncbi:right-handed parallel beta-helix repeat-containing protein [Paenibacillus contaminans]|uniref:Right handed beta helix domain-containing protein n=1 Tax=Paenibacillus contaminans TaxID=450362 RepID=A0A329LZ30_9BACL|nr:right-handed parallel beta-helix repeat-containing protein [Paenibacillus contaminans]RAV09907.1 hypothetical protein DQG23_38645 [Paenibacillus contaminans]
MREIYVSLNGNDHNIGTIEAPFLTLARANEEVNKGGCSKVILRQGMYVLDQSFELTNISDLQIIPFDNEEVRIIGAKKLDISKATNYKDGILQYDLRADDIQDYGKMNARGFGRPYIHTPMELFINHVPQQLVRYPKKDNMKMTEVLDSGSVPRHGDFSNKGGTFRCDHEKIFTWQNTEEVYLNGYFGNGFADDSIKVADINKEAKTITLTQAHLYGVNLTSSSGVFHAVNIFEELSEPGEYYMDRKEGILYFYPIEGLNMETELMVSMLEDPMFCLMNCTNVSIQNMIIEMCRGIAIYMEEGKGNHIDGCILRNIGVVGVCIGKGVKPDTTLRLSYTGELVSKELGGWGQHIYDNHDLNRMAGEAHLISNCHIYETGAGGIHMGGGDRITLTPANNEVRNCSIHDCNRWDKTYKACINIEGVGNKISHCKLYDAPGFAIYLHGNDHVIEYNEIFRVCKDVDDAGAIYMGRDQSERGNIFRYNYFHDIISRHDLEVPIKDGFGVFAIYTDDGACDAEIYGNVFYRAGNWAIANNGGSDHKIRNNVFIQSPSVIWHTSNVHRGHKELVEGDPFFGEFSKRLFGNIDITKPPYITKYPELAAFFEDEGYPRRNIASHNVVLQCLNFITTWHNLDQLLVNPTYLRKEQENTFDVLEKYPLWYEQYNNLLTHDFPELLNVEKWDFDQINKKIKTFIPDFEDIPFHEMGLELVKEGKQWG